MNVKQVRQQLSKQFKTSAASMETLQALSHVPYGVGAQCLSLDLILGRPGFPAGRLTEVVGLEGRGKSTHIYHVLAECQRLGGIGVLLEAEYGFEPMRLQKLGINITDLILLQPKNLEESFEMIQKSITLVREDQKFQGPLVIALDSIAGLPSSAEEAGDYDDHHMASGARVISQALRKLMWVIAQHKVVLIFVNQFRHSMEKYGDPYTTSGGMSIGYRSTVRLRIRSKKGDTILEKGTPVGTWIETDAFKNKIGVPFRQAKYYLDFATGIDPYEDLWRCALQLKMVRRSGPTFKLGKDKVMTRELWPIFLMEKFKDIYNARNFLTKEAIKRGLMSPYE